ncbi:MAG TPA: hypothetical protein VGI82_03170 [Chitinophagaceae bacterium]|jgi:hypothetical protein
MLQYTPIKEPDHLLNCCDPDPNPADSGSGDCSKDIWQTDKIKTDAKLKIATTVADMKQKEFTAISDWYDALKAWCNDWETADKYADTLCRNLELFSKHLCKVGEITEKTSTAIEILFCMIRELYTRVDLLKEKYDELYKCINCLKAPELSAGGVRACLDDYGVKLTAVIATRDDVIAKVIAALELAYELHDNISDQYGLVKILDYWKGIFKCGQEPGQQEESNNGEHEHHNNDHERCELLPYITFPIDQSKYFERLRKERDDTKRKFHDLKKESYEANEKKAAMQALSDGLNNAISSIANSGKCK